MKFKQSLKRCILSNIDIKRMADTKACVGLICFRTMAKFWREKWRHASAPSIMVACVYSQHGVPFMALATKYRLGKGLSEVGVSTQGSLFD